MCNWTAGLRLASCQVCAALCGSSLGLTPPGCLTSVARMFPGASGCCRACSSAWLAPSGQPMGVRIHRGFAAYFVSQETGGRFRGLTPWAIFCSPSGREGNEEQFPALSFARLGSVLSSFRKNEAFGGTQLKPAPATKTCRPPFGFPLLKARAKAQGLKPL